MVLLHFKFDKQTPMKNYIFILSLILFSCSKNEIKDVNEKEDKIPEIKFDFYPNSTTDQIIYHTYYFLSYSEEDEQAEWVAYKLTSENIDGDISRTDNFRADNNIKTGSAQKSDYYKSGYDRGHLAPAGSMKINYKSMSESFFMSNMSPQKPGFNRGIWKKLEAKVRSFTEINDSVFVVSGPILDNPLGSIGGNEVTIPRAYYKTLLGYKNGKAKGIAFIMPHESSSNDISYFAVSIDSVEEITNIDFYQKIDKKIQDEFEKNDDMTLWLPSSE